MPAKAGIHGAAAPGAERWIPASAGMTVARRRERRNRRARGAAICVLALAPAVLATGEAAAQSAALKLDQVEGRTVTLTATVPTVCDVGAFSIQWGDGSWQQYTLYPGEYRIHHYSYPTPEHASPSLRIRFDHTMCDDEYVARQYVLSKYAGSSVDRHASKRYVFRLSPGGCDLDLVSVN